ncbi:CRISPR-associated endoribonuclease Cas6 [Streptomyces coeruleorubidus]|uniref:CRISPR-associated endoribonuclease Cas6 n=1 Tax=Streptomyces coeruleorubidus TaxID=116188 RepID=UPI0033F40215
MRLRLEINTRAREIPWGDVLAPGRGVIYDALYRTAPKLAAEIHENGWGPHGIVPFGHSAPTFPNAPRVRGRYATRGTGYLEIGSPIPEVVQALALDFMNPKRTLLDWGGVALQVSSVTVQQPPSFANGRSLLRTANPLHLSEYEHPKPGGEHTPVRALLPEDPAYPVALERNLNRRAETFGHTPDITIQAITWVGPRRSFRVTGQGHSGHRTGAPVEVEVSGSAGALATLWSAGMGQQTGAGFGWVIA